eukprot:maker-scaffold2130_size20252-snap-gene-0.2 protein:Tk02087 transcript:maker-scaffold2130_size20252-snap-gene-0.2-mRNA-1 annotation:"hypothetical protein"
MSTTRSFKAVVDAKEVLFENDAKISCQKSGAILAIIASTEDAAAALHYAALDPSLNIYNGLENPSKISCQALHTCHEKVFFYDGTPFTNNGAFGQVFFRNNHPCSRITKHETENYLKVSSREHCHIEEAFLCMSLCTTRPECGSAPEMEHMSTNWTRVISPPDSKASIPAESENDLKIAGSSIQSNPEIKLLVCGICRCENALCRASCEQECFCENCNCESDNRCRRECNRCSDFCRNCNCRVAECAAECPKCVANCNTCRCRDNAICNRVCPKCFNCDICDCNLSVGCASNCLKCNTDCSTCRCSLADCESQCRKCFCPVRPPIASPDTDPTLTQITPTDDYDFATPGDDTYSAADYGENSSRAEVSEDMLAYSDTLDNCHNVNQGGHHGEVPPLARKSEASPANSRSTSPEGTPPRSTRSLGNSSLEVLAVGTLSRTVSRDMKKMATAMDENNQRLLESFNLLGSNLVDAVNPARVPETPDMRASLWIPKKFRPCRVFHSPLGMMEVPDAVATPRVDAEMIGGKPSNSYRPVRFHPPPPLSSLPSIWKVVDDILVPSATFPSHMRDVLHLLKLCFTSSITLNPDKMVLGRPKVIYVGF